MPHGSAPAGTVTFLFTDIEGSTKMWEAHPDIMRVTLARHDALLRQTIQAAGGYVFKTIGDAFCAAFSTPSDGVNAVLNSQIAIASENWPKETPIRVRMALHTGAAESRDNDYFGPPVNRVARLLGVAHGGQSILSQATFELIRDFLPPQTGVLDLGSHLLKDLARPEQIFQLVHPELRSSFPELRSLSKQPNNLPLQLTSFVGRESEIDTVKAQFERFRLITLTGTGGSGKTRLSIQIAAEILESFPDGVWLIELAGISDDMEMVRSLAGVLGVVEDREIDLTTAIANSIRSKSMLIILDNCEHIIDSTAKLADALLKSCPQLKILATSREQLGIAGESTLRVPPLSIPDSTTTYSSSALSQYGAVQLFIDRALQADQSFSVTNSNAPAVASICCQLDGIPLAIELAAARVRSLPVDQIEARLVNRFQLLTGGSRVSLPRQQTLRALIDWSYGLLSTQEKTVFQRLSVFSGGWTLAAAEAVCSDDEIQGWDVSDIVLSLVDKSLVVVHDHSGIHRYLFLESIREFAREHLVETDLQDTYQERHLNYYVQFAKEGMAGIRGKDQKQWLSKLDPEQDNFRAALRFGVCTPAGLTLAGSHWWYWYYRGQLTEGRAWLMSTLEGNPNAEPVLRADALNGAGVLAEYQGDLEIALLLNHESEKIYREADLKWQLAMSLNNIGNVYSSKGEFNNSENYWTKALTIWLEIEATGKLQDVSGLAASLDNLGNIAFQKENWDEARDFYQQGYEMRLRAGNQILAAYSLVNLGALETKVGNHEAALHHFQRGLETSASYRENFASAYMLMGIAFLAPSSTAAIILGRCEALREELATPLSKPEAEEHQIVVDRIIAELGEPEFDRIWALGRSMDLEQIIQTAHQVHIGSH